jgi:hypothetical protein
VVSALKEIFRIITLDSPPATYDHHIPSRSMSKLVSTRATLLVRRTHTTLAPKASPHRLTDIIRGTENCIYTCSWRVIVRRRCLARAVLVKVHLGLADDVGIRWWEQRVTLSTGKHATRDARFGCVVAFVVLDVNRPELWGYEGNLRLETAGERVDDNLARFSALTDGEGRGCGKGACEAGD